MRSETKSNEKSVPSFFDNCNSIVTRRPTAATDSPPRLPIFERHPSKFTTEAKDNFDLN